MKNKLAYIRMNWIGSNRQQFLKRHLPIILHHLTFKKVANILLTQSEYLFRRSNPKSYPMYIKIEPTVFCHLRCPGCLHKDPEFGNKNKQLQFDDFKKIIDPLSDTLIGISLSHTGEPLWCDDLINMIEYAHKNNIGTMFPSNLSMHLSEKKIEQLVKSGLDMILVSLDGATKETYNKYRIGGNFNLVVENVKKIANVKNRLGSDTPHIQWKFIAFNYNKHEIEYVKTNYLKMGFDSYSIKTDNMDKTTKENKYKKIHLEGRAKHKRPCLWPWHSLVINWDGSVSPCCKRFPFTLGNAIRDDLNEIWRGKNYKNFRLGFGKNNFGKNLPNSCKRCIGMQKKNK